MKTIINFFRSMIAVVKDPDIFLAFQIFIRGIRSMLMADQGVVVKCDEKLYVVYKFCESNEWRVGIIPVDDENKDELKDGMIVQLIKEEDKNENEKCAG